MWNNLGETGLQLWSTDGIGAWREADLSGATSATLSFNWAMLQTEAGDTVTLEVSTDGGLSWTTLDTYVGPLNHSSMQTASYDISAHIDNDTRIKFETVSGFGLKHGEAVAVGMVVEAEISRQLHHFGEDSVSRLKNILEKAGLPVVVPDIDIGSVMDAMQHDKKVSIGKSRFVLLNAIGNAFVTDEVSLALVEEVLNSHA